MQIFLLVGLCGIWIGAESITATGTAQVVAGRRSIVAEEERDSDSEFSEDEKNPHTCPIAQKVAFQKRIQQILEEDDEMTTSTTKAKVGVRGGLPRHFKPLQDMCSLLNLPTHGTIPMLSE